MYKKHCYEVARFLRTSKWRKLTYITSIIQSLQRQLGTSVDISRLIHGESSLTVTVISNTHISLPPYARKFPHIIVESWKSLLWLLSLDSIALKPWIVAEDAKIFLLQHGSCSYSEKKIQDLSETFESKQIIAFP